MKTKSLTLIAAILFATAALAPAATNDLSSALQKGLFEEEANHNFDAAIAAYQSVATQFDKDRKLAATAVFRLGEVYRKQGKTNEANAQYERIVREFSDQTTLVGLARKNLPEKSSDPIAQQTFQERILASTTEDGEIARIKAMIKDSPDLINALRPEYAPLHTAASKGQIAVAEFLLANGADVNRRSSANQTPLFLAAESGHRTMVELLISKGADVNAFSSPSGETALHTASAQGFKAVAEVLLANNAEIAARGGREGNSPLHLAAKNGHKAVAEFLLSKGANVNDKNHEGRTPLFFSVSSGNLEMTKLLIEKKADVNSGTKENWTPLHEAVLRGPPMVKLLVQNGADIDAKTDSPNQRGWTPLRVAVERSAKEIVEMLLKSGANPSSADLAGVTPLHRATSVRQEITELLLAHKADVNAKTVEGDTPLLWAVRGSKPMVELLLAHEADPNIANNKGETPLAIADKESTSIRRPVNAPSLAEINDIRELLIEHGADEHRQRRTQINITRDFKQVYPIFNREMNSWNRFSLLEAFGSAYEVYSHNDEWYFKETGFPFPNLARIKIHRLEGNAEREILVDLEAILKSGDCSQDLWLEWGDVIEIPEKDHKLGETWRGFSKELVETLSKCLKRSVSISVKGETTPFVLAPKLRNIVAATNEALWGIEGFDFWLNDTISSSRLLRSSSDSTRVKVTRLDPTTKKTEQQIFNLKFLHPQNHLWLRDGDQIEIPEKP